MALCRICKPDDRPAIRTQTAFKGDYNPQTCEECGDEIGNKEDYE